MRPGKLDQRIGFYRETETGDGMGGFTTAVSLHKQAWAHVKPGTSRENVESDRLSNPHVYTFTVRHRTDINAGDRIRWRGVDYNIRAFNDWGNRAMYLDIVAERGVAQ